MKNYLPKTIFVLFIYTLTLAAIWLPTNADDKPTAVHLASFDVEPLNNAVLIEWSTGSELDTAGFRIKRADPSGNGAFLENIGDNGFIASEGGVAIGGNYSVTDNQVQNGDVFTYILVEIENSGTEVELAQKTVTVGIPPTNTPIVISGDTGTGNNSTSTSTPTATSRATTDATATPAIDSNTIEPTATRQFAATFTPRPVEPAASPTQNSRTTGTTQTSINNTNENTGEEITNASISGMPEVFAQEENNEGTGTIEIVAETNFEITQQTQDEYPGATPTTAVLESDEAYPQDTSNDDPSPTPVPIIGSTQGYTGFDSDSSSTTTNNGSSNATSQGRVFLWLGFIVALLIFATGLIGSIVLFTRRAN